MKQTQFPIVITVVIMAAITAVGLFLAWSYISRRDEPVVTEPVVVDPAASNSYTVTVEGVDVVINPDPSQLVRLVGGPVPEPPQALPEEQPTETPVPPTPEPTPVPDKVIFIDYVVQSNDTMYGVALRLDTSIALMAQEGIAQDNLVPGTTIKLPIGNPAYCPERRPYAVAEGDTVYNISRTLGVSLDDLKAINNLNDAFDIKAADILCVP